MTTDSPGGAQDSQIAAATEKPNLKLAVIGGLAGAFVGAVLWAIVTILSGYQIGWMAIGVGFLVGMGVSRGQGSDFRFGLLGAVMALFGCALGNVFSVIGFIAKQEHMYLLTLLTAMDYKRLPSVMSETFSATDLLFYGIAIYEGYRFSILPRRR